MTKNNFLKYAVAAAGLAAALSPARAAGSAAKGPSPAFGRPSFNTGATQAAKVALDRFFRGDASDAAQVKQRLSVALAAFNATDVDRGALTRASSAGIVASMKFLSEQCIARAVDGKMEEARVYGESVRMFPAGFKGFISEEYMSVEQLQNTMIAVVAVDVILSESLQASARRLAESLSEGTRKPEDAVPAVVAAGPSEAEELSLLQLRAVGNKLNEESDDYQAQAETAQVIRNFAEASPHASVKNEALSMLSRKALLTRSDYLGAQLSEAAFKIASSGNADASVRGKGFRYQMLESGRTLDGDAQQEAEDRAEDIRKLGPMAEAALGDEEALPARQHGFWRKLMTVSDEGDWVNGWVGALATAPLIAAFAAKLSVWPTLAAAAAGAGLLALWVQGAWHRRPVWAAVHLLIAAGFAVGATFAAAAGGALWAAAGLLAVSGWIYAYTAWNSFDTGTPGWGLFLGLAINAVLWGIALVAVFGDSGPRFL